MTDEKQTGERGGGGRERWQKGEKQKWEMETEEKVLNQEKILKRLVLQTQTLSILYVVNEIKSLHKKLMEVSHLLM